MKRDVNVACWCDGRLFSVQPNDLHESAWLPTQLHVYRPRRAVRGNYCSMIHCLQILLVTPSTAYPVHPNVPSRLSRLTHPSRHVSTHIIHSLYCTAMAKTVFTNPNQYYETSIINRYNRRFYVVAGKL